MTPRRRDGSPVPTTRAPVVHRGLAWIGSDDPTAEFDADWAAAPTRSGRRAANRCRSWWRPATAVVGGCVSVAVGLSAAHAIGHSGSHQPHHSSAAVASVPGRFPSSVRSGCPSVPVVSGGSVTGDGAGGAGSGPDAVMAFETGYYVARSGAAARAVTTPDANVPAASFIQAGIDSVPVGTGFCVAVSPTGTDRWDVDVTENRPNQSPRRYRQAVTTTTVGGRVLITGITQR